MKYTKSLFAFPLLFFGLDKIFNEQPATGTHRWQ